MQMYSLALAATLALLALAAHADGVRDPLTCDEDDDDCCPVTHIHIDIDRGDIEDCFNARLRSPGGLLP